MQKTLKHRRTPAFPPSFLSHWLVLIHETARRFSNSLFTYIYFLRLLLYPIYLITAAYSPTLLHCPVSFHVPIARRCVSHFPRSAPYRFAASSRFGSYSVCSSAHRVQEDGVLQRAMFRQLIPAVLDWPTIQNTAAVSRPTAVQIAGGYAVCDFWGA